jgi:hypothetical protein
VFDEYPAGFFLNPKKKNEHAALTGHCNANARTHAVCCRRDTKMHARCRTYDAIVPLLNSTLATCVPATSTRSVPFFFCPAVPWSAVRAALLC